ncbi:MAG: hypothetical protein LBC98_07830 [Prevotellaceae bacterium]|nr:hypothetical protein [Prevotellaceae bacterium]
MNDSVLIQGFDPETVAIIQGHLDAAIAAMKGKIRPLTPTERHNLAKMGDKTLSFVEKSKDYAHQYPELCPPYFDLAKFDSDFNDATILRTALITAKQIVDNLSDTMMSAGSVAFNSSRVLYVSSKTAASQDVPGAKEVYNDLKNRFPRTRKKTEKKPEE